MLLNAQADQPTCDTPADTHRGEMAKLKQIVRMLEAQRRELLEQLDAVDRALAALGTGIVDTPPSPTEARESEATTVLARLVKARRVLTDSHKQALNAGRRKARQRQDVVKGLAREMPEEGFVPAIGARPATQAPRLVKRPTKK